MKSVLIAAGIFCVALIGIAYYFATQDGGSGPRLMALDIAYEERVERGAWVKGAAEPTVTLVEYADFQCPGCRAIYPIIVEALAETESFARLEFHHYPLPFHNKAQLASQAAESAGRQGKFWEMHERLFVNQSAWEQQTVFEFRKTLEGYAQALDLNVEQFKRDMGDSKIKDNIDLDITKGDAVPVTGTPTLLLNGKQLDIANPPLTTERLVSLINAAAADPTPTATPGQ